MDPADAAYWQSAFGLGMLLAGGHAGEHPPLRPRTAAHLPDGGVDPGFAAIDLIDLIGLRSALASIPAMDSAQARRVADDLARDVKAAERAARSAQDMPGDRGRGGAVRLGPGPVLVLLLP